MTHKHERPLPMHDEAPCSASATEPQNRLARAIIETAQDAFIGMDENGLIVMWNSQSERMFGWKHDEAIGESLNSLVVPEHLRDAHAQGIARFKTTGEAKIINQRVNMLALRRSGELFPIEMTITIFKEAQPQQKGVFLAFIYDLTERNKTEQRLVDLARTDVLTELPNRRHLTEHLHETMARVDRTKRMMALLFLDIDHFKSINDSLGHDIGDQLLRQFGKRLQKTMRQVDFVGRLGGDEFMMVVEELANEEGVETVAQKILNSLAVNFEFETTKMPITTSIGIALYAGGPVTADALIRRADQAMYQAKRSGRNTFKLAREDTAATFSAQQKTDSAFFANLISLSAGKKEGSNIDQFMQETLRAIRTHLGMDVAFISHFTEGKREFSYVDSLSANPPITVGGSDPLEDSYCQRVVDGRLPGLLPDAFLNAEAMSLPATRILPVRAHISVPIILKGGEIYGTYCCFSYSPDQSLNERDLSVMQVFADQVARQLESEST